MKIIITEEDTVKSVAESVGSVVNGKYFYIPGWFEKLENGDFQFHHMTKLPKELVDVLQEQRGEEKPKKNKKK